MQNNKKTQNTNQTYYSLTQANFFKAYGDKKQYLMRLNQLLNYIQKRKAQKLLEEVKIANKAFRKYFNQKRIINLKIQDVFQFYQLFEKQERCSKIINISQEDLYKSLLSNVNTNTASKSNNSKNNIVKSYLTQKKSVNFSLQSLQMIKKGFMSFLQKLQTHKKQQFVNKAKYLQSILQRQTNKLANYGYELENIGIKSNFKNTVSVIDQLQKQQKMYGLYPIVMKSIRDQTSALQRALDHYQNLINN